MTLTLWRGDQLRGELRKRALGPQDQPRRPGKPRSLSTVVIAAPGAQLIGVWQVNPPIPGFAAVHQFPIEPDIVADRGRREATRVVNPGPIALQPMSPEEAQGVPREVQLTVHDAEGRVYLPLQVRLEEVRYEPAQYEIALREIPAEALINGSVWCAFIVFASDLDAPAT
jgi:hypothetical protein